MASDRIGQKSANLVAVPPFEIRAVTTNFLLEQPQVAENIMEVPLNEKLMESIQRKWDSKSTSLHENVVPTSWLAKDKSCRRNKENYPDFDLDITVHRF